MGMSLVAGTQSLDWYITLKAILQVISMPNMMPHLMRADKLI